MIDAFQITQRQYEIILKQGLDHLPKEAGGFVGGNGSQIQAILPLANLHLYNKTDTFSFTSEDVERAHAFFKKHNMDYYGLYHTHPKGDAYPSSADIKVGHKYHFILSLRNRKHPDFAAFYIDKGTPIRLPFDIVSDKGFQTQDIRKKTENISKDPTHRTPKEEADHLSQMIEDIKSEKQVKYPKMPPKNNENESDFSTFA